MHPIIGITLDSEEPGGYAATVPWYALRKNYFECVVKAGGIPIALPPLPDLAASYASMIDGLVLTGGDFDIPPSHYGVTEVHPTVKIKPDRTDFEMAITKAVFDQKKPILGICGGMQLINVLFGGTLVQDIPSLLSHAQDHKQKPPYNVGHHSIEIKSGSFLSRITPTPHISVNSVHHQAVEKVAPTLMANAVAPDGIVEGIEHPDQFCIGVQWHPEYSVCALDTALYNSFIQACRK